MLMIAPAFLDHMSEKLHHEANVLKPRDGGKGKVSASSLQSTMDKKAIEIKKLKSEQGAPTDKGSGRQGATGFP